MIGCLLALAKHGNYSFPALAFHECSVGNFLFWNFMTMTDVSKFCWSRITVEFLASISYPSSQKGKGDSQNVLASFIKHEIRKFQSHVWVVMEQKCTKKCDVCADYCYFDVFNATTVVNFPQALGPKCSPLGLWKNKTHCYPRGQRVSECLSMAASWKITWSNSQKCPS